MSNGMFNSFLVILGFCMLGLPIILISVTTTLPGIDEFNSSIVINTIDGDAGYLFVCDSTNNNGITAKNKEIICDFYIKPALAAEYIRLTAIVTASGVSFSDVVG